MSFASQMRLYDEHGQRLYCNQAEVKIFLGSLDHYERHKRLYCKVLAQTGARPTEVRQLVPRRLDYSTEEIIFRTLKKRSTTASGKPKKPEYRAVPVPSELLSELDYYFGIREIQRKGKELDKPLWNFSRATAYRLVTSVMEKAGISGAMASPKGLRHAYGVKQILNGVDLGNLANLMGHSSTDTTIIYTQVVGEELRELALKP